MSTLPVKLLLSFVLISGLLAACAQESPVNTASSGRWPCTVRGNLLDSDISEIVAAVRRVPEIEHDIAWIEAQSSSRIRVYTGHVYGPLAGGGNIVEMTKRKGRWTVIGNPQTSAWNA